MDTEAKQDRQPRHERQSRKKKTRPGRRRKRVRCGWRILIPVLLLAAAAAVVLLFWNRGSDENRMERDVIAGQMPGVDHNNVQAQAGETEILFSINTNQVFEHVTGRGNILFENPAENQKLVRLQICRLDNGESIYESGLIKPGYYIAEETLDTVPEAGDYPCKAYVYGYRQNNHEYIGKVETDIIVSVQPSVTE